MEETFKKSDFTEIPIDEFISGQDLPVDLYISLSDKNYVKIAKSGDTITPDRLAKYKDKEVMYLLIKNADYEKYLQKGLRFAEIITGNSQIPVPKQQEVLAKVAANVFLEIEKLDLNPAILSHSKELVGVA